jgi:hypothetical protein
VENGSAPRPIWVAVGLFGTRTRDGAMAYLWASATLAVGFLLAGIAVIPVFVLGVLPLAFAAFWYWCSIKWVDNHNGW